MSKTECVVVSGGFDPIHVGHLRMFKAASDLAPRLVVIVNNDNFLNVIDIVNLVNLILY